MNKKNKIIAIVGGLFLGQLAGCSDFEKSACALDAPELIINCPSGDVLIDNGNEFACAYPQRDQAGNPIKDVFGQTLPSSVQTYVNMQGGSEGIFSFDRQACDGTVRVSGHGTCFESLLIADSIHCEGDLTEDETQIYNMRAACYGSCRSGNPGNEPANFTPTVELEEISSQNNPEQEAKNPSKTQEQSGPEDGIKMIVLRTPKDHDQYFDILPPALRSKVTQARQNGWKRVKVNF